MTLPQSKAAQESTFISLMNSIEDQVDELLDLVLGKLMRQFQETNPELYTAYREARVINAPQPTPKTTTTTTAAAS